MSLQVASLNSGSNGNCYYVGNGHEAVLIDAGLTCRETERRMARLKLSMNTVKAIFVSHEHSDHVRGIEVLSRKHQLPVYITPATLKKSLAGVDKHLRMSFNNHEQVTIGSLSVTPFSKQHDAADPYSFIVEGNGIKVGVITDVGLACAQVVHYFKQCHAAFLEANYDEKMLDEGKYSVYLKNRIRSGKGHLSNKQALDLFKYERASFMSHLFLSHISKENNNPQLVQNLFRAHAENVNIIIASRYHESEVYTISSTIEQISKVKSAIKISKPHQMSMFEPN